MGGPRLSAHAKQGNVALIQMDIKEGNSCSIFLNYNNNNVIGSLN